MEYSENQLTIGSYKRDSAVLKFISAAAARKP